MKRYERICLALAAVLIAGTGLLSLRHREPEAVRVRPERIRAVQVDDKRNFSVCFGHKISVW